MIPLFDQQGRTLSLGTGATVGKVVDGLLRYHAAKQFAKPITFYVVGGADTVPALSATEAVLLIGVMRTLRSPIRSIGLGWLRGWLPLVLAAGTPGQRYLIQHTLMSLAPLEWNDIPRANIGWQPPMQEQAQHQTERLLHNQIRDLLVSLNLNPELFTSNRVLPPADAIAARLADHVAGRILSPEPSPSKTPAPHHEQPGH